MGHWRRESPPPLQWGGLFQPYVLKCLSPCPRAPTIPPALRTQSHDAVRVGNAHRFTPALIDHDEMGALSAGPPLIRLAVPLRAHGQDLRPPWVVDCS